MDLCPAPGDFGFPFAPRKHIREYARMVLKYKWVIIGCVVTAVGIAAVHTLRQTPIYQATTQLEIDLQSDIVLPYQDFNNVQAESYYYDEFLQTQIKHITSRTLAQRVALAAGLDREVSARTKPEAEKTLIASIWEWFSGTHSTAQPDRPLTRDERIEQATGEVLGGISVKPLKNSRVVEIGFSSPDPRHAARIVNILAREYIDYNFQAKYDATTRATEFLQKQLLDLKAKVEESEGALYDYARQHNILIVGEKQDVVLQALADINKSLTEAQLARMSKESVYRILSNATTENFPQALRTPLIEKLEGEILADEQDLAKLTAQLGPSMPQVKQLESRVRQARQQLQREKQLAIDNSRADYDTAVAREKVLLEAFEKQKALANEQNDSGIHYNILRREVDTSKQLYDGLLQRMKEAGVAVGLKSSNIRVVDEAQVPISPISRNLQENLAIALMVGLAGGLGFVFFLNYLDNTVKTPEDVEAMIGLPSLGLIPSLQSARGHYGYLHGSRKRRAHTDALVKQGVELALLTASSSLIAESFRGVRTALLLSTPENPPKVILVTSARAMEGKTTTVCNTALSLTQAGKKVLILDCDLRRSKIKKIFRQNGSGLSEYLTGQIEFNEIVQESTIPNLFIAHSGTTPPNPAELLGSVRMHDAIMAAAGMFDFIFIDTPPLMSLNDALVLAPDADGVILVTKGAKNQPEILRRARKALEMVHARILGVVCNNVNLNGTGYYYYYRQYLEYESYAAPDPPKPGNSLNLH
jgi:capsular exopolysaccharide synthesis family protein